MQFNIHPQQEKQNMTTPHLKKSLDRSPSRLALLLIPLLLASFAIPAMGERDETPNHKEILLNFINPNKAVPCVGQPVDIRGKLTLKFGKGMFLGQRHFMPVDIDLAKGYGQINCPNSGECLVGIGTTTQRRFMADKRIAITGVKTLVTSGKEFGVGTCTIKLFVTGNPNPPPQGDPCPRCTNRFVIVYNLDYKFNKNDKVTFFKATPDIECRR
jgi:hypothetical protein